MGGVVARPPSINHDGSQSQIKVQPKSDKSSGTFVCNTIIQITISPVKY